MRNKPTAYELLASLQYLLEYLNKDSIFESFNEMIYADMRRRYVEYYFKSEFFDRDGNFIPKDELMAPELHLFHLHQAFVWDNITMDPIFMGYKLTKQGEHKCN